MPSGAYSVSYTATSTFGVFGSTIFNRGGCEITPCRSWLPAGAITNRNTVAANAFILLSDIILCFVPSREGSNHRSRYRTIAKVAGAGPSPHYRTSPALDNQQAVTRLVSSLRIAVSRHAGRDDCVILYGARCEGAGEAEKSSIDIETLRRGRGFPLTLREHRLHALLWSSTRRPHRVLWRRRCCRT